MPRDNDEKNFRKYNVKEFLLQVWRILVRRNSEYVEDPAAERDAMRNGQLGICNIIEGWVNGSFGQLAARQVMSPWPGHTAA